MKTEICLGCLTKTYPVNSKGKFLRRSKCKKCGAPFRSEFKKGAKKNPSRKYRLKSAKWVARKLRLGGLKKLRSAARKSRRNCGCGRKR